MGTADYQGIGSQYISGCILVVFDMFVCCQNNFCAAEEDEEMVDEESTEQIYRRNQDLRQDQSFEQSQDRDMEESIYARGQKGQARKNGKRS